MKGAVTDSSVDLYWTEPSDDGGCPIKSYSVLRDDGDPDSDFVEVHATAINDKPSLFTYPITDLPASPKGLPVRFKVIATNMGGHSVASKALTVVVASTPATPADPPESDDTTTSGSAIKIKYTAPDDGGSPITNYEI